MSAPLIPVWQSALLAIAYCFTCILQFIVIRYSKERNAVYDNTAAVMMIEVTKLLACVIIFYFRTGNVLFTEAFQPAAMRKGVWYAVPSFIYAVYNNLTFVNLAEFDAGTYQVLMQSRIIFTGLLFQYVLGRALGTRQWASLVLLAVGVAWKHFSGVHIHSLTVVIYVLFQALLSSFAGVYNEKLLKGDLVMDVYQQNCYMYAFAILFNLAFGLVLHPAGPVGFLSAAVSVPRGDLTIFSAIVVNGAVIGIITSLILKYVDVIVKAFASACEVTLTAVVAHFVLYAPLTLQDLNACAIVSLSIFLYYFNPAWLKPASAAGGPSGTGAGDRSASPGGSSVHSPGKSIDGDGQRQEV